MAGVIAQRPVASRPVRLGTVELGTKRSLICVPLMVEQRTDLRAEARAIAALAPDVVEWRADCLAGLEAEHVQSVLAALRHELRCALIVTCRLADEGGVGAWADADRLAILEAALDAGADAVDIEQATAGRERVLARGAALGRPVILSEHHLADTPDTPRLLRALEALQAAGAAAAKLVTVPCDPCDVTRFLDACLEARRTFLQVPLVAASGNQLGSYSRVVAPLYGIDLTFAAGPRGSVGGQLAIDDLRACRTVLGIP